MSRGDDGLGAGGVAGDGGDNGGAGGMVGGDAIAGLNREIECKWRAGEITWESFDWWLRWICGV